MLLRAVMLLIGLLGALQATGTWLDVAREWLLGEAPATDLGRLEARVLRDAAIPDHDRVAQKEQIHPPTGR